MTDLTAQDTRSWIEQDESGQEETDKLRLVIENLKNGREYLFEVMVRVPLIPATLNGCNETSLPWYEP